MHSYRDVSSLIIGCVIAFSLLGGGGAAAAVDNRIYSELLKKYVKDGRVNYHGFKSEEKKLDVYLKILETTDVSALPRRDQVAYYINAYNAWTIKLILTGYPGISSIWDLGGRFFNKPFKRKFIRMGEKWVSLDHIEHDILRPRFNDPRVHFAVNCASVSCPPLRGEPYCAPALDRQLDDMTRAFINDPERNYLKGTALYVSKIFKWFAGDFDDDIPGFFMKYATGTLKQRLNAVTGDIRIKYLDYNWSLNGD